MTESNRTTHVLDAAADTGALPDREWLVTNGTGAYAAGTAAGCNTRRYHGLLIAATRPPVGRVVLLNQMWEQLVLSRDRGSGIGDQVAIEQPLEFSTCMFRANNPEGRVFAPHGLRMLRRFERGLSVKWVYAWGAVTFERELFVHWKQQAATLRYRVGGLDDAGSSAVLRLQPMLTLRDFHGLMYRAGGPDFQTQNAGDTLTVALGDLAATFHCPGGAFAPNEDWWYGVFYPVDAERGQGDHEDHFVPGAFEIKLPPADNAEVALSVALGEKPAQPQPNCDTRAAHLEPIAQHLNPDPRTPHPAPQLLAIAADDFVVDRVIQGKRLETILAGYPWFADWGRDTFIALPGLLLVTGRFAQAKAVLQTFAGAIRDGLVPNRFDDYDDKAAHYNTVDASLWFIHAAMQYVRASGDDASWNGWLAEACLNVCDAYIRGTHFGIRMAGDCLIEAGSPDTQLTWMDAKCGDTVFTPRFGKAVEINALWHSALAGLVETLPDAHRTKREHFKKLCGRIRRGFAATFWREDGLGLYDHVWIDGAGEKHADASIRPNQVFVASLPRSPLPFTRLRKLVALVRDRLLTPFGLRTLPPDDPAYHPRYTGNQYRRDSAYHRGTIWPWLIGPYAEAVLRVGKFSPSAKDEARDVIQPLLDEMLGIGSPPRAAGGLGQLHEIYEAQAPHRPVGCFAQAWSVAEVLRVLHLIDHE